jgi:hypothetical protein
MRKRLACARGAHAPEVPPLLTAAVTVSNQIGSRGEAGRAATHGGVGGGGQILDALLQSSAVDRVR